MKNFFINKVVLEPLIGTHIKNVVNEAKEIADFLHTEVCFTFNGISLTVKPNRKAENIYQTYVLQRTN